LALINESQDNRVLLKRRIRQAKRRIPFLKSDDCIIHFQSILDSFTSSFALLKTGLELLQEKLSVVHDIEREEDTHAVAYTQLREFLEFCNIFEACVDIANSSCK